MLKTQPKKLTDSQLSVLFEQLYISVHAGLDLISAFELIAESDLGFPAQFAEIQEGLSAGDPLSGLIRQSDIFPDHAANMAEIAELSGRQEEVFQALGDYYKKQANLKQLVRQAVTYPVTMSVVLSAVFLILVSQVMPIFEKISDQLGIPPTALSQFLSGLGKASNIIFLVFAAIAIIGAIAGLILYKTGRFDENSIIKGKTAILIDQARFSSAMSLLLASGTNIETAFQKAASDIKSKSFKQNLDAALSELEDTRDLSAAITNHNIFNPMHTTLIRTACRAGSVDKTMAKISDQCQDDANRAITLFLEKLQYALIVILCSAIALVLMSVIAPMIDLLTSIG